MSNAIDRIQAHLDNMTRRLQEGEFTTPASRKSARLSIGQCLRRIREIERAGGSIPEPPQFANINASKRAERAAKQAELDSIVPRLRELARIKHEQS